MTSISFPAIFQSIIPIHIFFIKVMILSTTKINNFPNTLMNFYQFIALTTKSPYLD